MPQTDNSTSPKSKIQILILLLLVLAGGIYIGTQIPMPPKFIMQNEDSLEEQKTKFEVGKLEELIRLIDARYVDEVNSEEMAKQAIDNIFLEKAKEESDEAAAGVEDEIEDETEDEKE